MMLRARADLVDREFLRDAGHLVPDSLDGVFLSRDMRHRTREGYTGSPQLASTDKGQKRFDLVTEGLMTTITTLLSADTTPGDNVDGLHRIVGVVDSVVRSV